MGSAVGDQDILFGKELTLHGAFTPRIASMRGTGLTGQALGCPIRY